MLSPETVLITGSSRGIGLGLVKQFLKLETPPKILIASCRDPDSAQELQQLAEEHNNIKILRLDVSELEEDHLIRLREDVEKLLEGRGLNLLVNNAGFVDSREPITPEILSASFTVNAFAPLLITKTLMPLIQKAASSSSTNMLSMSRAGVLNISTELSSMGLCSAGLAVYRGSKLLECIPQAASNMLMKNLSVEYKDSGVLFLMMCPGMVHTDLAKPFRDFGKRLGYTLQSVEEACSKVIQVIGESSNQDQGAFLNNKGEGIPW